MIIFLTPNISRTFTTTVGGSPESGLTTRVPPVNYNK